MIEESIEELFRSSPSLEYLTIADLGCSSGPNAFLLLLEIIDCTTITCRRLKNRQLPEFKVFLNDLPGNDFNTLFRSSMNIFYAKVEEKRARNHDHFNIPCFISGTPGSFYTRLFPNKFLHFVHSSFSLHWLSQAPKGLLDENGSPMNKGTIHLAKTSPPKVFQMYKDQFRADFTSFLSLRSKELVPGGRMVLTMLGSIGDLEHDLHWESMGMTLNSMVLEGLIEKEKLDAFNLPFYNPSAKEVEELTHSEGSFTLQCLESFSLNQINSGDLHASAKFLAQNRRAVVEPILVSEFGEKPMDELFHRYQKVLEDTLTARLEPTLFRISLARKKLV